MDIPFINNTKVHSVEILIRNSIWGKPSASEERDNKNQNSFRLFMHYPMQLFRTASLYQGVLDNSSSPLPDVKFSISNMEVSKTND